MFPARFGEDVAKVESVVHGEADDDDGGEGLQKSQLPTEQFEGTHHLDCNRSDVEDRQKRDNDVAGCDNQQRETQRHHQE